MRNGIPKITMLTASALMMAGSLWALSGSAEAATYAQLTPGASLLAGTNRYQVALSVAKVAYPTATTAILASGANEADPLLASPLASQLKAPILLTESASKIGSITLNGLAKTKITSLILVGAAAANASAIKAQLPQGITVSAVYGNASPTATAASVAGALKKIEGVSNFKSVFAVSDAPNNLVDMVSAAPYAAMTGSPIMLVPPSSTATLASSEAPYLDNAGTVYIVGAATAFTFANTSAATQLVPLSGRSRSQTMLALDNKMMPNATSVFVADGENNHLVDALTVAPFIAMEQGALVYMYGPNHPVPTGTQGFLSNTTQTSTVNTLTFVGGPTTIPTIDYSMFEQDFPALGTAVKSMTMSTSPTSPTADSIVTLTISATSVAGNSITSPVTWSITGSGASSSVIESTGSDTAAFVAISPGSYTVSASVDGTTQTFPLTVGAAK